MMVDKRNIVLITFDSLRADHCSFMGYHRKTTPNMDKMARKGIVFENAISGSVPTAPSIFCCFTGEYPLLNSMDFSPENWRKELYKYNTIAQKLLKSNYFTAAFHSNPWVSNIYGFTKGFKTYIDPVTNDTHKRFELMDPKSKLSKLARRLEYILRKHPTTIPWEDNYSKLLSLINSLKEPFFLWILLYDTHSLYLAPTKYLKFSKRNIFSQLYLMYLYWKAFNKKSLTTPNKQIINAYDDAIRYSDMFVRQLLRDLGDKDPIYILHADHGDGFGEHGFYWHPPKLYEELVHVPLIIYNIDEKDRYTTPIGLTSLPRILHDCATNNLDTSKYTQDYTFSLCSDNGLSVSIRSLKWKLIYSTHTNSYELYNLDLDPLEQDNLYNSSKVSKVQRILVSKVKKFLNTFKLKRSLRSFNIPR